MLKNTLINRKATKKVATALGELNDKVVYVGGAMVSLYINDPAAEDIRPTKDIDLTFQIATYAKLEELREDLVARGFYQSAEDSITCRFRYEDLLVDVMATETVGWAPSNPWFKKGFEESIPIELDGIVIQVLPLPYFLATKLEAFFNRGIRDSYASHDLEDLVYLFNYTTDIDNQILAANQEVKQYLADKLEGILENQTITSAMRGSLYYEQVDERFQIIKERMQKIAEGA